MKKLARKKTWGMPSSRITFSILWCGTTVLVSAPNSERNTTCFTPARLASSSSGLKYLSTWAISGGRTSSICLMPVSAPV